MRRGYRIGGVPVSLLLCITTLFLICYHFRGFGPDSVPLIPRPDPAQQSQDISKQDGGSRNTGDKGAVDAVPPPPPPPRNPHPELVIASMTRENTDWVSRLLPDWSAKIYVVDDPTSPLTVPVNKGREAMVYLTYLIDNYRNLPDTIVFLHAARFQWHNDDPDYDILPALQNLNPAYIHRVGYANLRCTWLLGCPAEIRPFEDETPEGQPPKGDLFTTKEIFKRAFEQLMPDVPVPSKVGVSCCSQFAVTGETVRRRPVEDYIRYRQWLIETNFSDDLSGRVLEYAFHSKFLLISLSYHPSCGAIR